MTHTKSTEMNNTKDIHVVTAMYNLLEYGSNYGKTSESFYQYVIDEPHYDLAYS